MTGDTTKPAKPRSRAFRIRVTMLALVGIVALAQLGRLKRYAVTEGVLQSHSPDPEMLHALLSESPEPANLMNRIWETGKLPHRWEIINFLNRKLGDRPDLLPQVGNIMREAAQDPDLTLRLNALNLLRVTEHPEWQNSVQIALGDPDPLAREAAQAIFERAGIEVGTNAPATTVPDVRGPGFGHLKFENFKQEPYALSQYTNRPVLLHFFATWSSNCVGEIPELVGLRKIAPKELAIVGVCLDGTEGLRHDHSEASCCDIHEGEAGCDHGPLTSSVTDMIKAVERHVIVKEYNYPVVFDLDGIATAQLDASELPAHVLLDAEHRLIRRYAGTRSATDHDRIARVLLGMEARNSVSSPEIEHTTTNRLTLEETP